MKKFRIAAAAIIAFAIFANTSTAFAASANLRIKATVVQCGAAEHIVQACMQNSVCCGFVDQIAAAQVAEADAEKGAALEVAMNNAKAEVAMTKGAQGLDKVVTAQDTFFNGNDIDGNGDVTFEEFASLGTKATPEMFDRLDRNNDGALSKAELNKFRRAINS